MEKKILKENLKYICRKKSGLLIDLIKEMDSDFINRLSYVGFINTNNSTWKKTKFVDKYYIDLFGYFSYFFNIIFAFKK